MAGTPQWHLVLGEMLLGQMGKACEAKRKGWRGKECSVRTTVSRGETKVQFREKAQTGVRVRGIMGRGSMRKGKSVEG